MKVWTQHILRYVCSAAAVYLVATQVCSSFLRAGEAERQSGRGGTGPDTPSCRALFTVMNVPRRPTVNVSLFIHDLQGYSPPHKLNGDWRARAFPGPVPGSGSSAAAAGAVRQLLLKRNLPPGPSTADYSPLAALLPSVLARQAGGEGSAQTVTTTTTTRIGAAGGLLPYVPCQIATYADPASATACFRERLRKDDSLWIFFMGDSKIRNLFVSFIALMDKELHFIIKFPSFSIPFAAMDWGYATIKVNLDASCLKLPGLRVSFRFQPFNQLKASSKKSSAEVRQLARWAAGLEAAPHLLVLGYTSWTTIDMEVEFFHDALDSLMDMHKLVAPLLQQVSRRTRVIVTPQSRYKIYASTGLYQHYSTPFGDPIFDWSEAVLLHHLRLHTQQSQTPTPSDATSAGNIRERWSRNGSGPRDHLVPDEADGGVWWWDTSLPLSLAENSECEELYHRGLTHHSLYNSSFFRCNNDHHAGTVTLRDQVTMLLNLACNSVLGGGERMCCG
ncbi:uncharacterized protein LOC126982604 [Eriocheir sinensis]|uniref:uncharacterized protein LOC126982604 n=1 Tax=Eriocheir sinensis TaxID=95602 RepID=UPI0021C69401|nr:uncharacterized protein LOC126982604 [Eriocheir sinensis]